MNTGDIGQIAQLLSGTAKLAVYQETNEGSWNSSQDAAVTQTIVQAVQEAKLSFGVQAAAFASAINSTLFEQQQRYATQLKFYE